jgi:hypothetical protein
LISLPFLETAVAESVDDFPIQADLVDLRERENEGMSEEGLPKSLCPTHRSIRWRFGGKLSGAKEGRWSREEGKMGEKEPESNASIALSGFCP